VKTEETVQVVMLFMYIGQFINWCVQMEEKLVQNMIAHNQDKVLFTNNKDSRLKLNVEK